MALLTTKAPSLRNSHAGDANGLQSNFDVIDLCRLHDCCYELHLFAFNLA
jgi:hypothetical protein